MIYGADAGASALESAVRWLIIIIIFLFDPLAVLLLIAANYSLIDYGLKLHPEEERKKRKRKMSNQEHNDVMFDAIVEKTFTEEVVETLNEVIDDKAMAEAANMEIEEPLFGDIMVAPTAEDKEWDNMVPVGKEILEDWNEDETDQRMQAIAQNGNDGEHYDELEKALVELTPKQLEEVKEELLDKENMEVAKTDDKVVDNKPRKMSGLSGSLINDIPHN